MTMIPIPAGDGNLKDAFLDEFAWCAPNINIEPAQKNNLNAWFAAADTAAMHEQADLQKRQKTALRLALVTIIAFASLAILIGNPVPQLLCPVTVYLMIVYLDKLRQSAVTFRFAALRLLAETLRVVIAVGDKPGLRDYVLLQRGRSTHAVLRLTSAACLAARDWMPTQSGQQQQDPTDSNWDQWLKSQQAYFRNASLRERHRGMWGKYLFSRSFFVIGGIAVGAGVWVCMVPSATSGPTFRALFAVAAAFGSMGLAVINYVRERKAFDQSIDYAHMDRLFQGFHQSEPSDSHFANEEVLVGASLDEHGRWAIRMAGHFAERPMA